MKPSRILVVDDEPGMVRAVERVLAGAHTVRGTRSSREAVSIAGAFDPELAILDVRMPELDGFDLMAALQARHPTLDVILMTGSVDDLDEKLIRAIRGRAFYFIQKPFDHEVLKTLVNRCLELRRQREENRRHLQRLEAEFREARAFQLGLLPPADGVCNGVAVSCRYLPCTTLGGDFYDYAPASDGTTALLVADVSGHGVSAAMLTGIVKSAFRSSHAEGYAPLAVVERVRSNLTDFSSDRFITLFAALVSPEKGRLEYVSAGHPAALLWHRDGQPQRLRSTGPIVTPAFMSLRWELQTASIDDGDQLLLYTDGISDALLGADELDEQWLAEFEHRHGRSAPADAILAEARERLGKRSPDDLTIMAAQVIRPQAPRG
jgi:phosphoserine phosphatase RsbU/P